MPVLNVNRAGRRDRPDRTSQSDIRTLWREAVSLIQLHGDRIEDFFFANMEKASINSDYHELAYWAAMSDRVHALRHLPQRASEIN